MDRKLTIDIPASDGGRRLDAALASRPDVDLSRSRLQKLLADGLVLVDGVSRKSSFRLSGGEQVTISVPPPTEWKVGPEDIPLVIVHEDADILVIDKQRGLVVHPAAGHPDGTLVNAIVKHCPDLVGVGGVERPGLVHRLDRDTSGLMVVAKNDRALESLAGQIRDRTVLKEYVAVVCGVPTPAAGTIDLPIARHPRHRKMMAVVPGGRAAVTHYRVVESCARFALVRLRLETGRTHQIRVHMAHAGHPIVGDPVYGGRRTARLFEGGQALHAARLGFHHPADGRWLELDSEPPPEMKRLWETLCEGGGGE